MAESLGEDIEGFIRLSYCHTRAGGYLFSFSGFLLEFIPMKMGAGMTDLPALSDLW